MPEQMHVELDAKLSLQNSTKAVREDPAHLRASVVFGKQEPGNVATEARIDKQAAVFCDINIDQIHRLLGDLQFDIFPVLGTFSGNEQMDRSILPRVTAHEVGIEI